MTLDTLSALWIKLDVDESVEVLVEGLHDPLLHAYWVLLLQLPHHSGFKLRLQGAGCRVQGSGCRVQGARFRVQGSGFRIQGSAAGTRAKRKDGT